MRFNEVMIPLILALLIIIYKFGDITFVINCIQINGEMKLRHLFAINIFIAVFFGGTCTFFPHFVFYLYNLVPDAAAIWVSRLVGGSILGFATLMWFGMRSTSVDARKAISLALIVQDSIGCIASLIFQLVEKGNFFGWLSLILYGVLALFYASFLLIRKDSC